MVFVSSNNNNYYRLIIIMLNEREGAVRGTQSAHINGVFHLCFLSSVSPPPQLRFSRRWRRQLNDGSFARLHVFSVWMRDVVGVFVRIISLRGICIVKMLCVDNNSTECRESDNNIIPTTTTCHRLVVVGHLNNRVLINRSSSSVGGSLLMSNIIVCGLNTGRWQLRRGIIANCAYSLDEHQQWNMLVNRKDTKSTKDVDGVVVVREGYHHPWRRMTMVGEHTVAWRTEARKRSGGPPIRPHIYIFNRRAIEEEEERKGWCVPCVVVIINVSPSSVVVVVLWV